MKFGTVPIEEAAGAIAAHSLKLPGLVIRKGATISAEQAAALKAAGFLTRDPRVVERKKYGKAKARRSFQFSKR